MEALMVQVLVMLKSTSLNRVVAQPLDYYHALLSYAYSVAKHQVLLLQHVKYIVRKELGNVHPIIPFGVLRRFYLKGRSQIALLCYKAAQSQGLSV